MFRQAVASQKEPRAERGIPAYPGVLGFFLGDVILDSDRLTKFRVFRARC